MPRRRVATKREILPDPKYGSVLLAKFINVLMEDGKRSIAEKIVYGSLDKLAEFQLPSKGSTSSKGGVDTKKGDGSDKIEILQVIFDRVRPTVEVRSRRVGGATYQIPMEVKKARGIALAMRWLVQSARQRNEKGMTLRLANEMLDALNHKGAALKKREDMHRMAKANQAFAHFRWS